MRALALIAGCLAAWPTIADEGEAQLSAALALEAATIRHPLADVASADPLPASLSFLPRVALGTRYGMTNELQLGVGLDVGGAANVVTDRVFVGGQMTRLITGGYFEVAAPVTVGWRVDSGYNVSGAVSVELAPTLALWSASAATDPAKAGDGRVPPRLPIDIADELRAGAQARLVVALDARFFGAIGTRVGAYIGAGWAGSPSVRVGVLLEPSWIVSLGPP